MNLTPSRSVAAQATPSEPFDWARQWYAMAAAADLDPGRPHAMELLGQPLVRCCAAARRHITLLGPGCYSSLWTACGSLCSKV